MDAPKSKDGVVPVAMRKREGGGFLGEAVGRGLCKEGRYPIARSL